MIDNNHNGYVDHAGIPGVAPAEPGCNGHPWKNTEYDLYGPLCNNGIDDDSDGGIDYRLPGYQAPVSWTNVDDAPGDVDCLNPTDNSEGTVLPLVQNCTGNCTDTINGVDTGTCDSSCQGRNGCPMGGVVDACGGVGTGGQGRQRFSSVQISDTTFAYCCGASDPYPAIDASTLTFQTNRDRLAAKRISRTSAGDTVILNLYNFKFR